MGKGFYVVFWGLLFLLAVVVILLVIGLVFYNSGEDLVSEGNNKGVGETGVLSGLKNFFSGGGGDIAGRVTSEVGGSGGGGGSGGAGGSSPSGSKCEMRQISYALKNFEKSSTCSSYSGPDCIDKTVDCSVETYNLDGETSGTFVVRFDFFVDGDNLIESVTDSHVLQPGSFKIFNGVVRILGENAGKNIDCRFNTEQVPQKEVCS